MESPRHFRVFLCSPSDVADERASAIKVIDQLQYDPLFRNQVTLESVAWDKIGDETPLSARMTPQEAINQGLSKPSDCDVVVVILWARMGTPLPDELKKPDGSRYLSGTEWEFEDALQSSRNPKSEILVYRCSKKVLADMDDPDHDEKKEQFDRVKAFFKSFVNPDGSIKRGYNEYKTPENFRSKLEQHLKSVLSRLLQTPIPNAQKKVGDQPPPWSGSPFPGLKAFTPEEAPIFFGRGNETDELVEKLQSVECRFLGVLGDSGSGKSSLVGAGLLPRLKENAIPGSKDWHMLRFAPGEAGNDPFLALAIKLAPMLGERRLEKPSELAKELFISPENINEMGRIILASSPQWAELVLFIDQFEELFTTTDQKFRAPFIKMLQEASSARKIRMISVVRVDYYHECTRWSSLVELFQNGSYFLAPPGSGALYEMITRPADRAGLHFEEGLAQRIVDDVGANPGALALMAYTLDELYHVCEKDKHLTHQAYEDLGMLQGAIGKRAEAIFKTWDVTTQETLPRIFHSLVQLDALGQASRCRADTSLFEHSKTMTQIVDTLTGARLLVKSRSNHNLSTVEVAHEALFRMWPRFEQWISENRNFLSWRQRLQSTLSEWEHTGKEREALLRGARLIEADDWLNSKAEDLSEPEVEFIIESKKLRDEIYFGSQISGKKEKLKTGLKRKFIYTILLCGILPLFVSLSMAFLQGTAAIRKVSGESFEALATEIGRKVDLIVSDAISRTSQITTDVEIIRTLEQRRDQLSNYDKEALQSLLAQETEAWTAKTPALVEGITQGKLVNILHRYYGGTYMDPGHPVPVVTRSATRGLFITDVAGRLVASLDTNVPYAHAHESWWQGSFKNGVGQPYLGNITFNEQAGTYTFTLSLPIMDSLRYQAIGVLHRIYDANEFFTPSIDTIRFGKTGHVMLIDSKGIVLSCPILPTGTQLSDSDLIPLVTPMYNGWTEAPSDGHGGTRTSIIGFNPLPNTSRITQASTGRGWHMFVWQSSIELFAPIDHLFTWISVFGLLATGLLITLGTIAARKITTPLRRLQEGARKIGGRDLKEPIVVKTGDELEDLADEFNRMNNQIELTVSELKSRSKTVQLS